MLVRQFEVKLHAGAHLFIDRETNVLAEIGSQIVPRESQQWFVEFYDLLGSFHALVAGAGKIYSARRR